MYNQSETFLVGIVTEWVGHCIYILPKKIIVSIQFKPHASNTTQASFWSHWQHLVLSSCPDLEGIMGISVGKTQTWVKMTGLWSDNDTGDVLGFLSIWTDRTLTRRWLNPGLYDLKITENDWILMMTKLYEDDKAWLQVSLHRLNSECTSYALFKSWLLEKRRVELHWRET